MIISKLAVAEYLSPLRKKLGIKPLSPSPINVKKAAYLLPLLKTLVAPGFCEPKDLGSGNLNIFELIIANGIEPIRYSTEEIMSISKLNIFSDI